MSITTDRTDVPVAIVGMACRLPGAANLEQYWQLISQGKSAVGEVPPDRLNREIYYHPEKGTRGKTYSTKAALLHDRTFNRQRCPLPQSLIDSVDNTHLLMTEVAAEAFRHAGYDPFQLPNRNVSVFIGHAQGSSRLGELTFQTYLEDAIALLEQTPGFQDLPPEVRLAAEQELLAELNQQLPPGPSSTRFLNCNMVAGTVAKAFGLDGSWLALNSACASSLHAMLMGARALQRGRADAVVVGGASDCKSDSLVLFSNAQTLTKDDSRPFDANADGLIMSEGYVALVMKTLDRAIADGDPIQAVVRGLGVATDGRGKSLWAPRKEGQIRAMRRAYRSGADASRLQYQECHATATQVGDATELETLREVLEPQFAPGKKIPITSAKANIGHSLEAAGIAGMIKTVLCMQHKQFPAAINIQELNRKVPWDESPFFVPMKPAVWEAPDDGGPRCAGVNAFGIGGLNMHVVIDEYIGQTTEQICGPTSPVQESADDRAIAVIGMGCIVPGADELDQFWNLVESGTDVKRQPPGDRWSPQSLQRASHEGYVPLGGFIEKYEYDWRKHRVPPKQVQEADPLQFMFLDASEKALADAGYDRDTIPKELAGVVVCTEFGGEFSDQLEMGLRIPEMQAILNRQLNEKGLTPEQIAEINENFSNCLVKKWPALVDETGSFTSSTLASRISKTLDLKGGAVAIDSGATSGMSGIALCIDSLLSGDNDMMICAAGQRRMGPTIYDGLNDAGILSKDGQAKNIWDADFNGIVPSEGVAVVVLKRLADARRDGDKIRAVIRGLGAATHDDPAEAMRLAVERSSAMAGIDPAEVEFVDIESDERAEVSSSSLAMLAHSHVQGARQQPLSLASTTAQFGQMGGGGPILALLKAALESQKQEVAQGIGIRKGAGPNLETVLRGNSKLSQRGLGGVANWAKGQAFYLLLDNGSHVAPKPEPSAPVSAETSTSSEAKLIRLGATSHQELLARLNDAVNQAESIWNDPPAGRFAHSDTFRLAIVADSLASFSKKLAMAASQLGNASAQQVLEQQGIFYRQRPQTAPRVAFVFPGQGSQYEGMLKELVAVSPEAAEMIAEADAAMQRHGFPTFSQLAWEVPTQLGKDVFQTQIAMLLADIICLATIKRQGITPDLVLGHSYGEFPALFAAGVWSLDDVIRMTKARCDGILATSKNDAGLLATTASPEEIKKLIAECGCQAYLANFNAPDQTVIGGKLVALQQLATALKAKSLPARILAVPAAFHTPLMAGSSRLLQQALETAQLTPPSTMFVSTVDNQQVTDVDRIKRNLGIQLTTPVKYVPLIEHLDRESPTVFVEVGPHQTLTKLNRKILSGNANVIAVDNPKRGALESLLGVQGLLECLGVGEASVQPVPSKPNTVSTTSTALPSAAKSVLTPSHEMNLMDDIPHFDATERRRAKMRGASDRPVAAAPQAQPASPAVPPQPVGPPPVSPPKVATPPAPKPVPPIAPPSAPGAPQPVVPPAAPAMNGSGSHYTNGSTNGSVNGTTAKPAPKSNDVDLEKFLVNFVVEQTGYPPEVVDLDADLEADLGIDSIKKAQLFGELQEYFEISTSATALSLDDFPTLRHVVDFLAANGQSTSEASASPAPAASVAPVQPPPPQPSPPIPAPATNGSAHTVVNGSTTTSPVSPTQPAELESFLVNFVVEQTGYPPEVVDLDADLEADLGIDSIKKAQLFGELQEYFEISTSATDLSLDDFPTLRHVLDFLSANGQQVSTSSNANEASSFSPAAPAPARETKTFAPAVTSSSMAAEATDISENEWQEDASSLRIVAGTPYEMGYSHGSIFRDEIRRTLQTYTEYVGESVEELPGSHHCQSATQLLSPDQLDELQGIADAVEAPLTNLLVHHFVTAELLSQSEHSAAEVSDDAGMSHVARVTSQAMGPLRETICLAAFLRQPAEGISHISVTPIGTVLCLGGLNRDGLAAKASGNPDLMKLLGTSSSLESAIDVASSFENLSTASLTLSERSTQRLATVECTPQGVQIASDGPFARQSQRELVAASGVSSLSLTDSDWNEEKSSQPVDEDNQDALVIVFEYSNNTLRIKPRLGECETATYDLAPLDSTPEPQLRIQPRFNRYPLAPPKVTARFEMEMRDAPLPTSAEADIAWQGAAIILGAGPTADALIAKLSESGVVVYQIADTKDLDAAVSQLEAICSAGPAPHLFITSGRDGDPSVAMADLEKWNLQQRSIMETPLFVCQKWLAIADKQGWLSKATVVATTSLGGDFGFDSGSIGAHSGALTGLMKAIFIEYTVMRGGQGPRVKAFDTNASDCPQQIAEDIFRELASGNLDYEVSWSGGSRRVPYAVDTTAENVAVDSALPHGAWVVTGGARGITAACALELGKRYGVRLHLLGSSPLPEIDPSWRTLDQEGLNKLKAETMIAARKSGKPAPQAWERVQKSLEIDRSLRAFKEAGVSATYHVCDVSNRESLATVLEHIRSTDGPISGILHGAGIDKSCRFEKKRLEVVNATIGIKAGGLVNLAALTQKDPIRHLIGFGSIAGRLGSFGQADYCQASDLLCKLMGNYRRQRPWVRTVGFHWHGWDEVGMAARPETQSVLQDKSDLNLMPLAEGLGHFIREIEADTPRSEVLITERRHWQRFADGLGQLAESKHQDPTQKSAPSPKSSEPLGPAEDSVELRTQRCELKQIEAPLSAATPEAPTFRNPVWIVGENADAVALQAKLEKLGAQVHRFGIREDLDALLADLEGLHPDRPAGHLFLLSARDTPQGDLLSADAIENRRHNGIIAPFFIAQAWYKRLLKSPEHGPGMLVAATNLGGDFGFESTVSLPDGGGMAGFVKSLHIEDSRREERAARCKVIDAPAEESSEVLVDALLREAASDRHEVEVGWSAGKRSVVRPIPVDLPLGPVANIPRGGVWVVTGGARGITAIAARELAQRYGWKLHLFGKSPPPIDNAPWRHFDEEQLKTYKTQITRQAVAKGQSPGAAWDRVLKDCEIFNNLQKFAEAGIQATYHQCDVTSREELAAALDKVRTTDGPVTGVMHGAGLIEPGRFEHKRRGFVEKLVRTKFDGLMHLLALTKDDPLTHCIGFGSISGRFGGNGLSDYAAGNDSMSKALDWHRKARPDCTTICIHWESWEGAGIATLSRFAWGPRSVMKMKYMLPEEGVRRLEEEMAGGGKKAETLYTFGDFYPMFYPEEQYPLGDFKPRSGEEASDVPLIETTRREGSELVGNVPLDPTADPFLIQHRLRGKPIMPVVATLEALREVAALASGKTVVAFRDVDMVDGLVFHTDNSQTAQARGDVIDEQLVQCRWTCDFRNRTGGLIQKDRLYLEARAVVADAARIPTTTLPTFPSEWHAVEYPEDSAIYHGQPFRCLKAISCDSAGGWGHILAQPLADLTGESKRDGWLIPSCVLDSALYACGCHLYLHGEGAVSLPRKIELLELGRLPQDGENCYVHFTCRSIAEKSAIYDMVVVGQDGTVILKATGYEKVILMRGEVK